MATSLTRPNSPLILIRIRSRPLRITGVVRVALPTIAGVVRGVLRMITAIE